MWFTRTSSRPKRYCRALPSGRNYPPLYASAADLTFRCACFFCVCVCVCVLHPSPPSDHLFKSPHSSVLHLSGFVPVRRSFAWRLPVLRRAALPPKVRFPCRDRAVSPDCQHRRRPQHHTGRPQRSDILSAEVDPIQPPSAVRLTRHA